MLYTRCQDTLSSCIQDTLSSRAALGLPLGRVRRASKGILHTTYRRALAWPSARASKGILHTTEKLSYRTYSVRHDHMTNGNVL